MTHAVPLPTVTHCDSPESQYQWHYHWVSTAWQRCCPGPAQPCGCDSLMGGHMGFGQRCPRPPLQLWQQPLPSRALPPLVLGQWKCWILCINNWIQEAEGQWHSEVDAELITALAVPPVVNKVSIHVALKRNFLLWTFFSQKMLNVSDWFNEIKGNEKAGLSFVLWPHWKFCEKQSVL